MLSLYNEEITSSRSLPVSGMKNGEIQFIRGNGGPCVDTLVSISVYSLMHAADVQ